MAVPAIYTWRNCSVGISCRTGSNSKITLFKVVLTVKTVLHGAAQHKPMTAKGSISIMKNKFKFSATVHFQLFKASTVQKTLLCDLLFIKPVIVIVIELRNKGFCPFMPYGQFVMQPGTVQAVNVLVFQRYMQHRSVPCHPHPHSIW